MALPARHNVHLSIYFGVITFLKVHVEMLA